MLTQINGVLWGRLLPVLLVGSGIWFSIQTGWVQRQLFAGLKQSFCRVQDQAAGEGGMTPFQALATTVGAQVGTGNLAGAATAIAAGGMGAIFWMWVSAFFGMATNYVEAVLAQRYRQVQPDGTATGGPVWYIRAAFPGKTGIWVAGAFACLLAVALGPIGSMVQSNSIGGAFFEAFGLPPLLVGTVTAMLAGIVFLGGMGRLAAVTEKLVPVMAGFYLLGCLAVLAIYRSRIGPCVASIFRGAFIPQSLFGGAVGTMVRQSIRYGVARGLFSNEAGMGTTPHAHALAQVRHPARQGTVALVAVFIDTFCVLTLTALVIGCSGVLEGPPQDGIALTQAAFERGLGGLGAPFIALCMFFFAFSSILGWYFFAEQNIRYLLGQKAARPFAVLVCFFVVLGSTVRVDQVWSLADLFNGLLGLPNLAALLRLSKEAAALARSND